MEGPTYFLQILLLTPLVVPFNIDTKFPYVIPSPGAEYRFFGYSVRFLKEPRGFSALVGAPNELSDFKKRPGSLFRCSLPGGQCRRENDYLDNEFDSITRVISTGDTPQDIKWSKDVQTYDASNDHLGLTIETDQNGNAVICAPLLMKVLEEGGTSCEGRSSMYSKSACNTCLKKRIVYEPVGDCFYWDARARNYRQMKACSFVRIPKTLNSQPEPSDRFSTRLGHATCGSAASLFERNGRTMVAVGGPGFDQWVGAGLIVGDGNNRTVMPPLQKYKFSSTFMDNTRVTTTVVNAAQAPYIGYAMVTIANRVGDKYVVTGAPRGGAGGDASDMSGAALIWNIDDPATPVKVFVGEQTTSYFGSVMTSCDINSDGLPDLIVGAPQFNHVQTEPVKKVTWDAGKVYVFCQRNQFPYFFLCQQLVGEESGARFGSSLACAGDIDRDGDDDLLIGAPFSTAGSSEDFSKSRKPGSLYLYSGFAEGRSGKQKLVLSQVIYGTNISSEMEGFGMSIHGGYDVDFNEYTDTIVGSYKSGHVVYLRSRPVVNLNSQFMDLPNQLDPEDQSCQIREGSQDFKTSCHTIQLCHYFLAMDRVTASQYGQGLELSVKVELDVMMKRKRLLFRDNPVLDKSTKEFSVRIGKDRSCQPLAVYLSPNMRNKLDDVVIRANYTLRDDASTREKLLPVLHYQETPMVQLSLKRDCGSDRVCVPDLGISEPRHELCSNPDGKECSAKAAIRTTSSEQYVNVFFDVTNKAEDAYQTKLFATFSPELSFRQLTPSEGAQRIICMEPQTVDQGSLVECLLGNPVKRGSTLSLKLSLQVSTAITSAENLQPSVKFLVNSTNPEDDATTDDNLAQLDFEIAGDAALVLNTGHEPSGVLAVSVKDLVVPEDRIDFVYELGPKITHRYEVRNDGVLEYKNVELHVIVPTKTLSGKELLYVAEFPKTTNRGASVSCEARPSNFLNPRNLGTKDSRRRAKRSPATVLPSDLWKLVNWIHDNKDSNAVPSVNDYAKTSSWFNCSIKGIKPNGGYVLVDVESYLVTRTLVEEGFGTASISSVGIAQVKDIGSKFPFTNTVATAVATNEVKVLEEEQKFTAIPWWVWLIAVLTALILLALIVLLLWKLNFFKRTKPPTSRALLSKGEDLETQQALLSTGNDSSRSGQHVGDPKSGEHL